MADNENFAPGAHYGKALGLGVLDRPNYRERTDFLRERGYGYQPLSDLWVNTDTGETCPDALVRDCPVPKYGAQW